MGILDEICRQKFTFSEAQLPTPPPPPVPNSSSVLSSSTSRLEPEGSSASSSGSTLVPTPAASPVTSPPSPARHSSRDPLTPRKKKLRARLDFVSDSRSTMKKKHQNKLRQLRENLSKSVSLGHHNRAIRRKVETISRLRSERRNHQCGDVQVTLSKKLSTLRQKHRRLKKARLAVASSSSDVEKLKEQAGRLKAKEEEIRALQDEKLVLLDTIDELKANSRVITCKRDNKTYSASTRMMVYDAVVEQVPTVNIPPLLQSWSARMGIEMTDIPARNTVELMARELGVIASVQAAEIAMETEHLTLGFDATTQDEVHVNSIHFTTEEICVVVAIDQLAGGTALDYKRHVCDSIDELALLYSSFNDEDYELCRSKIIGNISNTMTDRVNVNHAAIELIKAQWNKDFNELNCHLHPLDTIASSCRSALKKWEDGEFGKVDRPGSLYGNDCMAGNIVLQMNKFRYKNGKGDPNGFVVFLEDNKLGKGLLPRYRGNRLHILFHICRKLMQHHSLFLDFLTTGTVSCGGLQGSLRKDFSQDIAQLEMQVLGLFGKLLSGPWMKKFYTSAEDQIDHVAGIEVVKEVVSVLKQCKVSPIALLNRSTDFFGDSLDEDDECLQKMRSCPSDPVLKQHMKEMLSACLEAVVTVLERQYAKYFGMDLTDVLRRETQSARSHNIDAEEVMGMFSAAMSRSPNATICYMSSRMRAKKNRTVEYLDKMDPEKREKLVEWSVGKGRNRRDQNRKWQKELVVEMSRRVADKRQKKTEKEIRALEKRLRKVEVDKLAEEFPELESSTLSDLADLLSGKAAGRNISHVWYDATTQGKTVYFGRIETMRKGKKKESLRGGLLE